MSLLKKYCKTFLNVICYIFISLVSASISIATFSFLALFIWFQSYVGEFRDFTIDFTIKDAHYYPISLEQAPSHLKNAFLASTVSWDNPKPNYDNITWFISRTLLNKDQNTPLYINNETLEEAYFTLGLRLFMPNDDLLTFYLNNIYFGDNPYGVEAAARIYFAKHVGELTLAESAVLFALWRYPYYITAPEMLKREQLDILGKMLALDLINKSEYNEAVSQPLVYKSMISH